MTPLVIEIVAASVAAAGGIGYLVYREFNKLHAKLDAAAVKVDALLSRPLTGQNDVTVYPKRK